MTYSEFCATQEDILDSYRAGELTEAQVEREMEQLQEEWEENGEDIDGKL